MIGKFGVMECDEMRKLGQVFLDDGGVILEEEVMEILGYECGEASVSNSLVVEVEEDKGSAQ